jgi:hypothetical protein
MESFNLGVQVNDEGKEDKTHVESYHDIRSMRFMANVRTHCDLPEEVRQHIEKWDEDGVD